MTNKSQASCVTTTWRSSAKWQADGCGSAGRGSSRGSSVAQMSSAFQQRVRNRHPEGGFAGDGTSPSSRITSRSPRADGSGTGTADSSAWVYGCSAARRSPARYRSRRLPRDTSPRSGPRCAAQPTGRARRRCRTTSSSCSGSSRLIMRLDRHVQRRHRLVAQDHLRPRRQRPCDADPLPLTARELVRVAVDVLRVQAHDVEQG